VDPASCPSFADILDEFRRNDFALIPGANAALIRDYVCGVLLWEDQYAQPLQQNNYPIDTNDESHSLNSDEK
jgi:hypothetical protein